MAQNVLNSISVVLKIFRQYSLFYSRKILRQYFGRLTALKFGKKLIFETFFYKTTHLDMLALSALILSGELTLITLFLCDHLML